MIANSAKSLSLDPEIHHLKDQGIVSAKEYNWKIIAKNLKKFGIKIDEASLDNIIKGSRQEVLRLLN